MSRKAVDCRVLRCGESDFVNKLRIWPTLWNCFVVRANCGSLVLVYTQRMTMR
jgi:hypothetical protein